MIIYRVTNIKNKMTYIGQTNRPIEERWREHCKPSLRTRSYLSNAIQKYGKEHFIVEELVKAHSQKELDLLEKDLINKNNSMFPNGYNLKQGGLGGKLGDEAKKKLRKAFVGKKLTKETKKKIGAKLKGKKSINCRPVIGTNLETGETIELTSAYADTRFHYNCIHRCAKGERKTHAGYSWKYKG